MIMKAITIKGVDFKVKNSFGAMMEFEKFTKRKVSEMSDSITDTITLLYCMLKYNNKENFKYSFDAFIDEIDADNSIVEEFTNYLFELQTEQMGALEEELKKKIAQLPAK